MISKNVLKQVAEIFCGDKPECYIYKEGYKLVEFFNEYFNYEDVYGRGFPSRWQYVLDKLEEMKKEDNLIAFFMIILTKKYIISEFMCTDVEAIRKVETNVQAFNRILKLDGYFLSVKNERLILVQENEDLEFIGEGGFAIVHLQKSSGLVIKKLKDEFITEQGAQSRFKREYDLTKSLENIEGVIEVYDYFSDSCSYTMKKADTNLERYLSESKNITEEEKINIIIQVLKIMKNVHNADVIHRDISPNNIFLINGKVRVADFGLGKDLNILTSHKTIHTKGVGQYRYCAPEQFMLLKDGDKKSDVYSLGNLINFILTGNPAISNHFLRAATEKSTNVNPVFRQADSGVLLSYVEKSIEYHRSEGNKEQVLEKISKDIYDENVENFIYELDGSKICNYLIVVKKGFQKILLNFMKKNERYGIHIIQAVNDKFTEECKKFEWYDQIALFAYSILVDKYPFVINEVAANILRYIAYDVNRFSAQRLVDKVIDRGVEPLIEALLKNE